MRFLILGAGGLGGYFGGRLAQAGQAVSFLVRERRSRQLARDGLVIVSPFHGDMTLPQPTCLSREQLALSHADFDVVILGCKAYDLDDAMEAIAPAVGADTIIVPLLNGVAHIERIAARFGRARLLGAYCMISAAMDRNGHIQHYNDMHKLAFGELDGGMSERVQALAAAFSGARCEGVASTRVIAEMWEKWMLIASAASITCLMRAPLGAVVRAGGSRFASGILDECVAIAGHNGLLPSHEVVARLRSILLDAESPVTASMYKDIEAGAQVEAEHLIGDLLRRRDPAGEPSGLLDLAWLHLNTYQVRQRAIAAEKSAPCSSPGGG
jgi:2-dehydropantoate 2-reductase